MIQEKEKINRIAILLPNKPFFGAMLVQLPLFQHLKSNFPNAKIYGWSPVTQAKFFKDNGVLDDVIPFGKQKFKIISQIRKWNPDIIINMRRMSEFSHLVVSLSGFNTYKVGFETSSPLRVVYNKLQAYQTGNYLAYRYLNLLNAFNISIKFDFDKIKQLKEKATFTCDKPFICLMPAGGEGEHKRWGIENFCRTCELISERHPEMQFVFIMGSKEEVYLPTIKNTLNEKALTFINPKIEEIAKIVSDAKVTISNDCGPGHLAQMCEVNFISVWGWKGGESPYIRIIEWFFARPNAHSILPHDTQKDIKTIPPDNIARLAVQYI